MTNMNTQKEYGIHDFFESQWKKKPIDVLKERNIRFERYLFGLHNHYNPEGYLYVYKTDPLTNLIILTEIGVTDDCPIAEIEVPC